MRGAEQRQKTSREAWCEQRLVPVVEPPRMLYTFSPRGRSRSGHFGGISPGGFVAGAGTRALTVSEIIDLQPLIRLQISAIGLCGLVLLLDGFDTQCIGFLAPSISQNLAIPLKSFGPVFSAGLVGLMIAAIAMGPLADRWGRRWPMILSVLTFAVFALLTARAASLEQLIVF